MDLRGELKLDSRWILGGQELWEDLIEIDLMGKNYDEQKWNRKKIIKEDGIKRR